jgi:hypothetical protein
VPSDVSIDLFLEGEDTAAMRKMIEDSGAGQISQVSERGLTGIEECLFAIMAVQALANLIIRLLPLMKSGVIVDARGSKVRIRKDRSLPNGSVIVIAKSGEKSTLHEPSEVTISNLLQVSKTT